MKPLACAILSAVVVTGGLTSPACGQSSFFGWWPYSPKEKEKFVTTPSMLEQNPITSVGSQTPPSNVPPKTVNPTSPATSTMTASSGEVAANAQPRPNALPSSMPKRAPESEPFIQSPFADWTWPQFQLPFMPGKNEVEETRNTWVEKRPEPQAPSPWQAVTEGTSKVTSSTKAAWRKTVDVFTPASSETPPPARTAQREAQPSMWNRMFKGEPETSEGPRTVSEWMGQERLKP